MFPAHLYLASQSPRRSQLLDQLGIAHSLLLPAEDEDPEALEAVIEGEAPADYVQRVAQSKLDAAVLRLQARGLPLAPVLCADTTVALGMGILGKPGSHQEAGEMLRCLAGRTHRVLTAVAVQHQGRRRQALSESLVRFAALSDEDIAAYVATGEPFGKAGAYAVQGKAAAFIEHISGSFSGIMGLPLWETAGLLRGLTDPDVHQAAVAKSPQVAPRQGI